MRERPILFNGAMVRAILAGRKTQTRRVMKPQPEVCPPDYPRPGHWWRSRNHQSMLHVEDEMQNGQGGWEGLAASACPFGEVGDRLWVRETWSDLTASHGQSWERRNPTTGLCERGRSPFIWYAADGDQPDIGGGEVNPERWRPSIHMPRSACRLVLEVTDVRVERLQAISESDVFSEGLERLEKHDRDMRPTGQYRALNQWLGKGEPDVWDRPAEAFRCLWDSTGGDWSANPWVWVVGFSRVQP